MTERFFDDLGFILFVLFIAFLLGFLIAWLLRNSKIKILETEIEDLTRRNAKFKTDLDEMTNNYNSCRKEFKDLSDIKDALSSKMSKLNMELMDCQKGHREMELKIGELDSNNSLGFASDKLTLPEFDAAAAKLAIGKKIKFNDLTLVEGIGPKIAGLLNDDGVHTWHELSKRSVESIQSVLTAAGDSYAFHRPDTWPKQAEMAALGQWVELNEWQDYLDGGVEPTS